VQYLQKVLDIFLQGLSFVLWLVILSKIDVPFACTIAIGLTLAFVLVGANLLLKESLTPHAALGMRLSP